jgi:hypothetical protein
VLVKPDVSLDPKPTQGPLGGAVGYTAPGRLDYSSLMFAALMMGHDFSISAFWIARTASGTRSSRAGTSYPRSISVCATLGSASVFAMASPSLLMTFLGVPLGAQIAFQSGPPEGRFGNSVSWDHCMPACSAQVAKAAFRRAAPAYSRSLRPDACKLHDLAPLIVVPRYGKKRPDGAR